MAIRISKPPSACTGVMVSPSTRAASATATIGSKVESVEARGRADAPEPCEEGHKCDDG